MIQINQLTENIMMYILEFLSIKDFYNFALVNKKFSQVIAKNNKGWSRECLRKYFSTKIDLFCEFYEDSVYKQLIRDKLDNLQDTAWKKLLKEGANAHNNLISCLTKIFSNNEFERENARQFTEYIFETLKLPSLPLPKLKRESIVCHTKTMFQTKLSEVLFENSPELERVIPEIKHFRNILESLIHKEDEIITTMTNIDKTQLQKARWYILTQEEREGALESISINDIEESKFEKPELRLTKRDNLYKSHVSNSSRGYINYSNKSSSIHINYSDNKNSSSSLILLYSSLYQIIQHHCKITFQVLKAFENVYDILAEYTARWNVYVASILEFENIFEPFVNLMNNIYEKVFPNYPSHPKFSIWRLMVKIWIKEVYDKNLLSCCLTETFLRVLSNHRERNIKESVINNFSELNSSLKDLEQEPDVSEQLPKNLYLSLRAKSKQVSMYFHIASPFMLKNTDHPYFSSSKIYEKKLLSNFLQSILDISLNEVTIHYLDCTDIMNSDPYYSLEEAFLKKSNEFYNDHINYFLESPNYFCQFLVSDLSLLSDILTERTILKLEKIQVQNGLQFIKHYAIDQLKTYDSDSHHLEKKTLHHHHHPLSKEIEVFLDDVIEECLLEEQQSHEFINQGNIIDSESQLELAKQDSIDYTTHNMPILKLGKSHSTQIKSTKNFTPLKKTHKVNLHIIKDKKEQMKLLEHIKSKYSNFEHNFDFLQGRIQHFEAINTKNEALKEYNLGMNIPNELGDIDELFYDLNKNIEICLLDKMHLDYLQFLSSTNQSQDKLPQIHRSNSENYGNSSNRPSRIESSSLININFPEEANIPNLPSLYNSELDDLDYELNNAPLEFRRSNNNNNNNNNNRRILINDRNENENNNNNEINEMVNDLLNPLDINEDEIDLMSLPLLRR